MTTVKKTKNAFTLIELVVAISIVTMVLAFTSVIFKLSIDSYRTAAANAEIVQKLQAITQQLNADFRGQRWKPAGHIQLYTNPPAYTIRADTILFFANGDFQSINQYDSSSDKKTVAGNIAAILYAQNEQPNPISGSPKEKILLRRQTILT